MTTQRTMADFIADTCLSMTVKPTDSNPAMDDSAQMDHWKCTIRRGRARYTVVFSKGIGHKGAEPTLAEVLDCLGSDAASIHNAPTFEEFASEMGMDTDSRKAERMYKACVREAERLERFLSKPTLERLMWATERE